MSQKLQKVDVDNIDDAFRKLDVESARLRNGFLGLGIDYANKILGTIFSKDAETYCMLRDSIYFRLDSMLFHLRLLLSVQQNHLDRLAKLDFNSIDRQMLLLNGREQQIFLFDSIIFHSISLFDYLGNTIHYLCGTEKRMDLRWNGVVRATRDKTHPISSSPVSTALLAVHSEFVDRLYEHRSDLIHYKMDLGKVQSTFDLMTAKSDLVVFAPKRFLARFPSLRKQAKLNDLTLNFVAFWLCEQTIAKAGVILSQLFEHLKVHRKVPPGKEPILFQPKNPKP